ncbi:acyltransferase [Methyloraptor flagellatus]|uniref:Chloramphenicol acetyltransferase n=1 Tax=Methyloraptor flagellatus TaxID=3162530 RepID=A0AAU7X9B7_9HYPH
MNPFYSDAELRNLGFHTVGRNTRVSRKASFYGVSGSIGDGSRIDDFCIVKGRVEIGRNVHVAAFANVGGSASHRVVFEDCATLSTHISIFTCSADYRADALASPLVALELQHNIYGDVVLGRGIVIGAHTCLLPGASIGDGASVGANLVVHGKIEQGQVVASRNGVATVVGTRDAQAICALVERACAS